MSWQGNIRLLLADVDGTLVTDEKVLTESAKAAARELYQAGIALAITSGRPQEWLFNRHGQLQRRGEIAGERGNR